MAEKYRKVFVPVMAEFNTDGVLKPVSIVWEDGLRYEIDRILDIRKAPSLKVGGCGLRFQVRIMGKDVYLFLDEGKWFMEARDI